MINQKITLSLQEAYTAMYLFLEKEYEMTQSDDIGGMLGGMSLLIDSGTADPAVWGDWLQSVEKVLTGHDDIGLKIIKELPNKLK